MTKLVFGVGFNDGKYPATVKGKITKSYNLWLGLLERCYCPKYQKKQPTYVGCQASENFKSCSYFHDWCQTQLGFGLDNFHLDKDFLIKGSKLYSENTCLFLPRELNNLFTTRRNHRGTLPIGVSARQGKFIASCCTHKNSRHIGRFNTIDEAFQAYKQAKEVYTKLQAEKWKDQIDIRAYEALMSYEVLITD